MSNLRVTIDNVGGSIAKEDERYTVTDNTALTDIVLSSTRLKPSCSTIELDGVAHHFKPGSIFLIEDNVFHKVNASNTGAYFVCVFNGVRYDHVAVLGYN